MIFCIYGSSLPDGKEDLFLHILWRWLFEISKDIFLTLQNALALRTSSASFAIKNPTVLATILTPRGLIMILVSLAEIRHDQNEELFTSSIMRPRLIS